jgi:hypothetical protein
MIRVEGLGFSYPSPPAATLNGVDFTVVRGEVFASGSSGCTRPLQTRSGIGGIMREMRTIPVLLDYAKDMQGSVIEPDEGTAPDRRLHLENLARQMDERRPDYSIAESPLTALELCEGAYRSSREGRAIALPLMRRYIESGEEVYSFAEAAQDQLLSFAIDEAVKGGRTIVTQIQPWAVTG